MIALMDGNGNLYNQGDRRACGLSQIWLVSDTYYDNYNIQIGGNVYNYPWIATTTFQNPAGINGATAPVHAGNGYWAAGPFSAGGLPISATVSHGGAFNSEVGVWRC